MAMDAGEISRLLFGEGCGPSGNAPAGEKQAPPPAQQEKPAPSLGGPTGRGHQRRAGSAELPRVQKGNPAGAGP